MHLDKSLALKIIRERGLSWGKPKLGRLVRVLK